MNIFPLLILIKQKFNENCSHWLVLTKAVYKPTDQWNEIEFSLKETKKNQCTKQNINTPQKHLS